MLTRALSRFFSTSHKTILLVLVVLLCTISCVQPKLVPNPASGAIQDHNSLVTAVPILNPGQAAVQNVQVTSAVVIDGTTNVPGTVSGTPASIPPKGRGVAYASFPTTSLSGGKTYTLQVQGTYAQGNASHSFSFVTPLAVAPSSPGSGTASGASIAPTKVEGKKYPPQKPMFPDEVNKSVFWTVPIGPEHRLMRTPKETVIKPAPKPMLDPPDFQTFTNVPLNLAGGSTVNEPSGGANNSATGAGVIFETFNWSAAFSTNGGAAWTTVNPTTVFPVPDAGFCCDQVVQYVPSIDRFIWVMQSCGSGSNCGGANRERIAATSPATLVSSAGGAWTVWDITPAVLNQGSDNFDFPDLAVGDSFLYLSFDDRSGAGGTFGLFSGQGLEVVRVPLSQIQAGGSINIQFTHPGDSGQATLGHLTQNPGDSIFWAGHNSNSSMKVFNWPENSNTYSWRDVGIGSWPNDSGNLSAVTPDGNNWLQRPQSQNVFQILGSTRASNRSVDQVLFAWTASRGNGFAQPHVQWVALDTTNNFSLVSQQQLFSSTTAIGYPALAINSLGEVGVSAETGGNGSFENHAVGFLGDNVLFSTTTSSAGVTRYGDYVTIRRDVTNSDRFDAFGYGVNAGAAGTAATADTRFVIFGRGAVSTPTFDRIMISLQTGNDNATDGSEIIANIAGQTKPLCLKPSNSLPADGICPNGGSGITWDNWSVHATPALPLDTPVTSTSGFSTMTISFLQSGSGGFCPFCDNWDIQGITVTASDSTGTLSPALLLMLSNPQNGDNCIARLKAPPNATSVRFGLDGTGSHVYTDGTGGEPGSTTSCKNNGG